MAARQQKHRGFIMPAFVEYQVRCLQCGHVHDESVEWLLGYREVVCPSCGGWIRVDIGDLTAVVQSSNGPAEVLDLSHWSPQIMKRTVEACDPQDSRHGGGLLTSMEQVQAHVSRRRQG